MKTRHIFPILTGMLTLATANVTLGQAPAPAGPSATEVKLRESLKSARTQLQTLEAEKAALEADKVRAEATIKQQAANLDRQTKDAAEAKEEALKKAEAQAAQIAAQGQDIAALKEALEKWKAEFGKLRDFAEKTEGQRSKLADEKIVLQRRVDEQQRKNADMYAAAKDILSRYEKFGLGTALTAREPFTGLMKTKLENMVQDLGDKITDAKIKPLPAPSVPPAPKGKAVAPAAKDKPAAPATDKPAPAKAGA